MKFRHTFTDETMTRDTRNAARRASYAANKQASANPVAQNSGRGITDGAFGHSGKGWGSYGNPAANATSVGKGNNQGGPALPGSTPATPAGGRFGTSPGPRGAR